MEMEAEKKRLFERQKRRNPTLIEKSGEAILDLVVIDQDKGMGDRLLVTLAKSNQELGLPWTRLKVGSPIVMSSVSDRKSMQITESKQGVVSKRGTRSIQVALAEIPAGSRFRIDLAGNDITHRRHLQAIAQVKLATGRLGRLRDMFFGHRPTRFQPPTEKLSFETDLNPSQQAAVNRALGAKDVAIIHGPPGTGKTTTVVELIIQCVRRGEKVLACAPSNTAVDNLVEKLTNKKQNIVRLGHSARVDEKLRDTSLDQLVSQHENSSIIREMQREIDSLHHQADRHTRARPAPGMRRSLRQEAKHLKSSIRLLELQAIDHIIERADCICATTAFDTRVLADHFFDLCIIDEACQCVEPGCWQPIAHSQRVVLAGDHCQLPPTIISETAAQEGFGLSLLERLHQLLGEPCTELLETQYRMHDQIMDFSSRRFYKGRLVGHASVQTHVLADLPGVEGNSLTDHPVTFIDTAGTGWQEELEPDGESKRNPNEANLVVRFCNHLMASGLQPEKISVIAPYAAQGRLLRSINPNQAIEIDTVDGFQGRENEAVVISLTRSNPNGEIGFLSDERRMNVALTRAKRKLIVIGDSATLSSSDFFVRLVEYFEAIGAYQSIWESDWWNPEDSL